MASDKAENIIEKMKNQVTFGHFVTIMSVIILPAIGWVITAEQRFQQTLKNEQEIEKVKIEMKEQVRRQEMKDEKLQESYNKIMEGIYELKLELKDKQDRY